VLSVLLCHAYLNIDELLHTLASLQASVVANIVEIGLILAAFVLIQVRMTDPWLPQNVCGGPFLIQHVAAPSLLK
jgi:hypothetical protein